MCFERSKRGLIRQKSDIKSVGIEKSPLLSRATRRAIVIIVTLSTLWQESSCSSDRCECSMSKVKCVTGRAMLIS